MLSRLASFSFRRRWLVVVAWLVMAVAMVVAAGRFGGQYADGGRLRGSDSDQAEQLFHREFPDTRADEATIVFADPRGLAGDETTITRYLDEVRVIDRVAEVVSPFDAPDQRSPKDTVGYARVTFTTSGTGTVEEATGVMHTAAGELDGTGVQTAFGGYWFDTGNVPSSELFGLIAAAVILLIAFGSVVAMGLPLVTAVTGIVIGLGGVQLWAAAVKTPDFTIQVASMIGIGVGIDYALFIVTRYRSALATHSPHDSAVEALSTAGRAVVFAGGTVMISLLGMLLMGLDFFDGLAFGSATAVLVAVLAAITLLPALLGIAGHRIDRLSIHRRRGARPETMWHRWSRAVQRRPVVASVGGIAVLLLLAAPVLGLRLASSDAGNNPTTSTTRQAYDLLAEGFGPGVNGPLVLVLDTPTDTARAAARAVAPAVRSMPGVAFVGDLQPSATGAAALLTVIPTTSPQSTETERLVRALRHDVAPTVEHDGLQVHVGGATPSNIDFAKLMADRLPLFIAAVLACSFVLLLVVFRSVLVPLKAVIMNLLSIGAAYGAMVAVFQWGWLGSWFGVHGGPIEPWAPMMLFAIVFGLSMDYEVFLLSSVKERYDLSGDNSDAVVEGLAATARVITAAAAIMVCVFGSFVFAQERGVRLIGFGLAVAVLIDATVVRMIVVPATMELLGRNNWWMPRWLDRLVPHVAVDGRHPVPTPVPTPVPVTVDA